MSGLVGVLPPVRVGRLTKSIRVFRVIRVIRAIRVIRVISVVRVTSAVPLQSTVLRPHLQQRPLVLGHRVLHGLQL